MALPDELLDELLSAHLDGALSGGECARVEQMLRDDSEVAQRLEQLRRQRDVFREAALATPALPKDFADQVVQAAIDQARTEGLRPDHPLQLAAKGSFVSRKSASTVSKTRLAVVIAGLAASILFIAVMVNEFGVDSDLQPSVDQLAVTPQAGPDPDPTIDADGPMVSPDPLVEPNTAIVASDVPPPVEPLESIPPAAETQRAPAMMPEVNEPRLVDSGNPTGRAEASNATNLPPTNLASQSPTKARPLSMLMVIEIEQTDAGRAANAFDQALTSVEIEASSEREVDQELARAVTQEQVTDSLDDGTGRVVLLESPAKKLDRLVNQLMSDREGIRSIGFSAITVQLDAPLLRSIESVRTVDPTKIRHQGQSFPIVSSSDELMDAWISQLGSRRFAPVRGVQDAQAVRMMATASSGNAASKSDNGPDQMANILFLIR